MLILGQLAIVIVERYLKSRQYTTVSIRSDNFYLRRWICADLYPAWQIPLGYNAFWHY